MKNRILIVESDAPTAVELEEALQEAGFRTVGPAFDGFEAAELMRSGTIDAAVLDPGLLGGEWGELVGRLGADGVPVLYLSGREGGLASTTMPMRACTPGDVVRQVRRALAV